MTYDVFLEQMKNDLVQAEPRIGPPSEGKMTRHW